MFWKRLALILTIIGGINWGLIGAFNFDLVGFLFGYMSMLSRIVYVAVGISSLVLIFAASCDIKLPKE